MTDGAVVGNRIRDNGVQCAPAAAGSGETVSYTATTVTDTAAYWEPDGHRGKLLEVQGHDMAVVVGNTATELRLAPVGADALVAFTGPVPAPGTPYRLPPAPPVRAGLAITAPVHAATVRDNRMWDSRQPKTQTHGIWIGERGSCVACRVENNDLADNAVAATWFRHRRWVATGPATTTNRTRAEPGPGDADRRNPGRRVTERTTGAKPGSDARSTCSGR